MLASVKVSVNHQQPEVNYLPSFSPQLISLERYTLSVYRAGEIDLFENLDIVHTRLLVEGLLPLGTVPCRMAVVTTILHVQGYLAHKRHPPSKTLQ